MPAARRACALFALVAVLSSCGGQDAPGKAADLVLRNGLIYTADDVRSTATAIAIGDERILAVGADTDVEAFIGEGTEVRDLEGAMVLPGLHDLHIHALGIVQPDLCDLGSQPVSLEQMVPVLRDCIERFKPAPGEWLDVLQWAFSNGNQPSASYPTLRAALDAVSTDHKIFLWGDDGHHGAANSTALAAVEDGQGRRIGVSAETLAGPLAHLAPLVATDSRGEPSGGVSESARNVVRPEFGDDMVGGGMPTAKLMPRVAQRLAQSGITSILDPWVHPATLDSYAWLENQGQMTFRLRAALSGPEFWRSEWAAPDGTEAAAGSADEAPSGGRPSATSGRDVGGDVLESHFEALVRARERFADSELIRADTIKLFADAVLEGNPLTQPPTQPVAAMLDGFKRPLFEFRDDGVQVTGYVTPESVDCVKIQESGPPRDTQAVREFFDEHGYYAEQCQPSSGVLEHSEEYIHDYVRRATEAGLHVHIHALADRGVRVAVDALEKVKPLADERGLSQSLAHLQVIHPSDVVRIGELGISTVFTFVWVTPEPEYELMVIPFIDEVKGNDDLYNPSHYYMQNVYPAKSVLRAGGNVVAGSDAPVGSRDPMPFRSLEQAITRSAGDLALNESEELDVHEAIAAFTVNGARLLGHHDQLGTLEVGKVADLIAIDQNLIELVANGAADQVSETRVLLTVFNGKVVFEAGSEDR